MQSKHIPGKAIEYEENASLLYKSHTFDVGLSITSNYQFSNMKGPGYKYKIQNDLLKAHIGI